MYAGIWVEGMLFEHIEPVLENTDSIQVLTLISENSTGVKPATAADVQPSERRAGEKP